MMAERRCRNCEDPLPPRRRVWCSDRCRRQFRRDLVRQAYVLGIPLHLARQWADQTMGEGGSPYRHD